MFKWIGSALVALLEGIGAVLLFLVKAAAVLLVIAAIVLVTGYKIKDEYESYQVAQEEKRKEERRIADERQDLIKRIAVERQARTLLKDASRAAEVGWEDEAKEIYKEVIKRWPDDPRGYYHLAVFLQKQGALRESQAELAQAYERRAEWPQEDLEMSRQKFPVRAALEPPFLPRADEMLAERAWLLFRIEDRDESERIFRFLYDNYPGNPRYRSALGYHLAYKDSGLDEAISLLEEAVKEYPDDPNALTALGWAKHNKGWLREAGTHLEKALRSDQDQNQYDYIRTLAHYGALRWEEEDRDVAKAIWREGWCEDAEHEVLQWTLDSYNIKFKEGDPRHRQSPRGAVICRVLDRLEEEN